MWSSQGSGDRRDGARQPSPAPSSRANPVRPTEGNRATRGDLFQAGIGLLIADAKTKVAKDRLLVTYSRNSAFPKASALDPQPVLGSMGAVSDRLYGTLMAV